MMNCWRLAVVGLVGLWGATLAGCGGEDVGSKQAVSGEVKLKGEPLDKGSIQFSPKGGAGSTMSGAEIKAGKYSIPREAGLDPGTYEVRVSSPEGDGAPPPEMPGEATPPVADRIPAEYNVTTKLEFTVEAGKDNVYNVEIP